ncbi:MAG: MarR family transcriptional regulator [Gaiellaceae bacterium]
MGKKHRADTNAVMRAAAFRAALRSFLRESEHIARKNGLTPQRYLLLLMIKGAPDGSERATVGELGERLQLAQSSVTELVQRAEEAGLVERAQSEDDARVAHLSLTDEGERRLRGAFTALELEREQLRQAVSTSDAGARGRPSRPL